MRLPIVFADDEGVPTYRTEPDNDVTNDDVTPVTVTSGDSVVAWRGNSGPYTRVIVASRGGSARVPGVTTRGGTRQSRPLLLRRTVRMVRDTTQRSVDRV